MIAVTYDYSEVLSWVSDLEQLADGWFPLAMQAAVTELGFFFEREAKMGAPVDTGRLRSSIGHGPEGIWKETFQPEQGYFIDVGTNVHYAPYMEFGFTMSVGHVAYVKAAGGFRYVHPFTFEGLHFFQRAANKTERILEPTIEKHIDIAIAKGGW